MLDLIWTVPPRSDGPDLIRVRGGGGARRGDFSRGGAAWEPAGLRRFGDSRTGLGRGLAVEHARGCLLYTSPSPRDGLLSRMPSSA